jgi:hypothetical protein
MSAASCHPPKGDVGRSVIPEPECFRAISDAEVSLREPSSKAPFTRANTPRTVRTITQGQGGARRGTRGASLSRDVW